MILISFFQVFFFGRNTLLYCYIVSLCIFMLSFSPRIKYTVKKLRVLFFLKQINQINNQWNSEGRGAWRGLSGMKPLFVTDRLPARRPAKANSDAPQPLKTCHGATAHDWPIDGVYPARQMKWEWADSQSKKRNWFVQDFPELLFYSYLLACRGQEDEAERRSSRMPRHRGQ